MREVIQVQQQDFDLAQEYQAVRQACGEAAGAIAAFVGLVRDHNKLAGDGGEVGSLTLEHYPGMTESSIAEIVEQAAQRWPLLACTVIHRIGTLKPEDQIVLVIVASAHRSAAFAAAEFVMDYLKTQAIFWKKEVSDQGSSWLESTQDDHQRAQSWRAKDTGA